MVSQTHQAGFLEKYRARKAHTKELASFSRQELELEHRKLRSPNPPAYEEIFGLPCATPSSPTTSASSSIYDTADDIRRASDSSTSSSPSPSRNRSREPQPFRDREQESERGRERSGSESDREPIDVNRSIAVRTRPRTSIRTTELLPGPDPYAMGHYGRATQITRPGQEREGSSSGSGRRMSFLRRAG